jgi:hypothetical protein
MADPESDVGATLQLGTPYGLYAAGSVRTDGTCLSAYYLRAGWIDHWVRALQPTLGGQISVSAVRLTAKSMKDRVKGMKRGKSCQLLISRMPVSVSFLGPANRDGLRALAIFIRLLFC